MPANFVGPSGAPEESGRPPIRRQPEVRRRRALLWLAAILFAIGISVQLIQGLTETWMQLAPLALSGLGIAAIGNCLFEDDLNARWLVRVTSALVAIGGLYGTFQHLTSDDTGLPSLFTTVLLTITAVVTAVGTCRRPSDTVDTDVLADEPNAP